MNSGAGRRQPVLPQLARNSSLCRQLKFATIVSPFKGYHYQENIGIADSISKARGHGEGRAPTIIQRNVAGLSLNSVAETLGLYYVDFADKTYTFSATGGLTWCALYQFNVMPPTEHGMFSNKWLDINVADQGMCFYWQPGPNRVVVTWSNGILQETLATNEPLVANRAYLILCRHWGSSLKKAELWVDGRLNAANNATGSWPSYNAANPSDLYLLRDWSSNTANGRIYMAGMWARPLDTSEITRLATNPYAMWQPEYPVLGRGFPHPNQCLCCGFLPSFYGMG
jgi:hypothetical protein